MVLSMALACAAPVTLAACGQQGGSGEAAPAADAPAADATADAPADTGEFATLGDVFAADSQGRMSTFDEKRYICAFSIDDVWWRVTADLPEGMYAQLNEAWVEDQEKVLELLSPLAVTSADAFETPSEDEIAALVGKTGADLTADGFAFSFGTLVVNGEESDCVASKGSFDYLITFDGKVADENAEDPAAEVAGLTVSAASIQGITWDALEAE